MKKIDWIILFFIAVISVITLKDLFKPLFFTSHDGVHQIVRMYYFDQAIKDGQIPPRWAGGLLQGFGYPLFIFSYHMPWIIAEPLHLLGLTIFDSVKMTFLIGFILSGITMYLYQKEMFGRIPALAGTATYLFAPYRFLNIFVRAAIGDATAFIFPPLIFLSIYKLTKRQERPFHWICIGGLSLAALLLSHAMVFMIFAIIILFYFLFKLFIVEKKLNYIKYILFMGLIGLFISAYYLIPSLIERDYTVFNDIMKPLFIGKTFLTLKDLIYSPWGYGTMNSSEGGMSFQVGIAQWATFIFCLATLIVVIIKKIRKKRTAISEGVFFFIVFIFSIILMLPVSEIIWQIIRRIALVDFSWRVLPLTVFSASLIAGYVVFNLAKRFRIFFMVFLVILSIYANRNHTRINQSQDWPLEFYLKLDNTTNSFDEYKPRWVEAQMVKKPKDKLQIMQGTADITINKNKSNLLDFTLSASASGRIRINTVYYPGWSMKMDGREKQMETHNGLMETVFEAGKYNYKVSFADTPLRVMSNIISVTTVMVVVFLLRKKRKV
jgi:hypothetical protein